MNTLIISDSPKFSGQLVSIIKNLFVRTDEIKVTSTLNGRRDLLTFRPKLVLLDIDTDEYPDMADYIVKLVPKYSVPIIVCTAQHNMKYTMISAGAMDVITLHSGDDGLERFRVRLTGSIETIVNAVKDNKIRSLTVDSKIIAIGGSTGSTNALPVILQELKTDCPPIVCTLHMPEGYTRIYAEQLNSQLSLDVCEAQSGMYVRQGQVIIAAGSKHLRIFKDKKGYFVTSEAGIKVMGHCPSVNVMFDSVAYAARNNAIGVILTGMGSDGAKGMLNMKKRGAYNIAQDEQSSIVYGMPKAAYDIGAANIQLPLEEIAGHINKRLQQSNSARNADT